MDCLFQHLLAVLGMDGGHETNLEAVSEGCCLPSRCFMAPFGYESGLVDGMMTLDCVCIAFSG